MESAFMKGLVNSPPAFQLSCSSGNCTWDDFSTIGICSSCADVTKNTIKLEDVTMPFNHTMKTDYADDGLEDDCITFQYFSPCGLALNMSRGCSFQHRIAFVTECDPTPTTTPTLVSPTGPNLVKRTPRTIYPKYCSNTIKELPTSIASNATYSDLRNKTPEAVIMIVAISQTTVTMEGLAGRISREANTTECQLSWCEKTFSNMSVVSGTQTILSPVLELT